VLVIPISLPPVRPGLNLLLGPCSSKCFATSRSLFGFGIGPAPVKHRPSVPCCHFPLSRTRLSSRGLLRAHRASLNPASAAGARSHCAQPLYFLFSGHQARLSVKLSVEKFLRARGCCCPVFILAAGFQCQIVFLLSVSWDTPVIASPVSLVCSRELACPVEAAPRSPFPARVSFGYRFQLSAQQS
jgi:hypothetical protein